MTLLARKPDRRTAGELVRLDRKVIRLEATEAWQRVHRLGQITETSAVVGRPDWAEQAGAELRVIAARQLRMLAEGGNDCA
jgi:hypothetical protein